MPGTPEHGRLHNGKAHATLLGLVTNHSRSDSAYRVEIVAIEFCSYRTAVESIITSLNAGEPVSLDANTSAALGNPHAFFAAFRQSARRTITCRTLPGGLVHATVSLASCRHSMASPISPSLPSFIIQAAGTDLDPNRLLKRVVLVHGIPLLPDWGPAIAEAALSRKLAAPLASFGSIRGWQVSGNSQKWEQLISDLLRSRRITAPPSLWYTADRKAPRSIGGKG
jgi:hypothetical protein